MSEILLKPRVILGPAGSGKTYEIRKIVAGEENAAVATATTGIAAYNLGEGAMTINSLFRFFDAESLYQNMQEIDYLEGMIRALYRIKTVVIDEISMMKGGTLDMITSLLEQISRDRESPSGDIFDLDEQRMVKMEPQGPLSIVLVGDFLQLPPVIKDYERMNPYASYAFYGAWWQPFYQPVIEKLTKIWRQTDPKFIEALAHARCGNGRYAMQIIRDSSSSQRFFAEPDYKFQGFSLYPTNVSVDKHNRICLEGLPTQGFTCVSERWGQETLDLKEIPQMLALKVGCRVRMTVNNNDEGYVNGELGTIKDFTRAENGDVISLVVELHRNEPKTVIVTPVYRIAYRLCDPSKDKPIMAQTRSARGSEFREFELPDFIAKKTIPFYNPGNKKIAVGVVKFLPVRLGYAATFHSSQGLQFDNVQIDVRNKFAGSAQMVYVALSRCKTLEGLRIVGDPGTFERRIITDPRVREFI